MIQPLQSLLQRAFMRVEAVFNAVFGDRLNPLYQLGAISFFLFWVIAATGLVLYAFFETSVVGAYASVQSLTHSPWIAGGVLRSLHRYASDAFVLTMLLHMLRHFAFNRFRGLRWFSWLTGIALLCGVAAAGINGLMLPWDQLAQFVVVASFEWLDWLPSFGGTLMRNFIHPASVSDRLFSLLSFMHVGLPLAVLLLMWVHVQRVPKARTQPPRAIGASLLLALVALSLIAPIHSQGGAANLSVVPSHLQLDWFYLALLPLLYTWPLGTVWALVVAATALLAALPWLPPRRAHYARRDFTLTVDPGARQLTVREGETLLDAGLREGLPLRFECRNGGCGQCMCSVLQGQVDHGPYQPAALPDALKAQGMALMCCAKPLDDLTIEIEWADALATPPLPLVVVVGHVESMERMADDMMRVVIALPEGQRIDFAAGQHIHIVLDDGQRRAYTLFNPPHENTRIELHIRHVPGGRFTAHVFSGMQLSDRVNFEGPLGNAAMRP